MHFNIGQHARATRFKAREPWLPPVSSTVKTAFLSRSPTSKNSFRTGRPQISLRPFGKYRRASSNATSARRTKHDILRATSPGIAFGSMITIGVPRSVAATMTGAAT